MENRAADHTFGCMLGDNPEFDGIPKEGLQIMKDPTNPAAGNVTVTCACQDPPRERKEDMFGQS